MPHNILSTTSTLQNEYEENQPHLECPKELQAKLLAETKTLNAKFGVTEEIKKKKGLFEFETELKWNNIIFITLHHVVGLYYFLTFPYLQQWKSFARSKL